MSMESDGPPCCAPIRPPAAVGRAAASGSAARPEGRGSGIPPAPLVPLAGGEFRMGAEGPEAQALDGEGPVRSVRLAPFRIAPCAVTNEQFAAFVRATGHRTDAEQFGWSFVFFAFLPLRLRAGDGPRAAAAPWWRAVEGAWWGAPDGPGSHLRKREGHPVVHVSWNDAAAYCAWAGRRLPSEAEWEYAARGGLEGKRFPWGDELLPGGRHQCNIWQGRFPAYNSLEDGYAGTAPAQSFPPNGYGLYNVAGNVWEWCADAFRPADAPGARVIRGGSYLCHADYCNRYRVAARSGNTPDSSTGNMGFRCAADAQP